MSRGYVNGDPFRKFTYLEPICITTDMKLFTLLFILIAPSWALAEYIDERFSINGVPIWVNLIDDAKEGCWTNIGEVRRYTEDKLVENGAVVS